METTEVAIGSTGRGPLTGEVPSSCEASVASSDDAMIECAGTIPPASTDAVGTSKMASWSSRQQSTPRSSPCNGTVEERLSLQSSSSEAAATMVMAMIASRT